MHYWYFTFYLTCSDGHAEKNYATISSIEKLFPIGNVYTYYREYFNKDVEFTLLNAIEISKMDFDYLNKEIIKAEGDD